MNKQEKIVDYLKNLADFELVYTHNYYRKATNNMDDFIYCMDDFDEIMNDSNPLEIARKISYGDFNPTDTWFWFDGYANLTSSDFINELPIYINEIAEYCVKHNNDLADSNIAEILNKQRK